MSGLELIDVSKPSLDGGDPFLDHLDLKLDAKQLVAIRSDNAEALSSLFNVLSGLDANYSGQVTLAGQPLASGMSRIGRLLTTPDFHDLPTATAVVRQAMQPTIQSDGQQHQAAQALLKMVGLEGMAEQAPTSLTFAQQLRLALAAVLVKRTELILIDGQLDLLTEDEAKALLALLRQIAAVGPIVLIGTSNPALAKRFPLQLQLTGGYIHHGGAVEAQPAEKAPEPPAEKPTAKPIEKSVEKPIAEPIEPPAAKKPAQAAKKPGAYLRLNDINKAYTIGKNQFPVLKGINLEFELGDFVSILGESGGGKTTLMNIIGGLDREFQGTVTVADEVLDHRNVKQLDHYRRQTVGYIYQSYNLISHLTVLDNVLIALDMTTLTTTERRTRAQDLLSQVGLSDQLKKHPNQLSGGQKQRVAIARALAADPKIIIADEPTGALDAQNTQEVLALLENIARAGKLVITVTHSNEVAQHGTRIVHLADGRIDGDERLRPPYTPKLPDRPIASRPLPRAAAYRTAWTHLQFNFRRNFLIILGTAIGLFAVMLFMGLGNGIQRYIGQQITALANPNYPSVTKNVDPDMKKTASQRLAAATQATSTNYSSTTLSAANLKQLQAAKHVDKIEPGYQFNNARVTLAGKTSASQQYETWTSAVSKTAIKAGHAPKNGEVLVDKTTVAMALYHDKWRQIIGKTVQVAFVAYMPNNHPVNTTVSMKVAGVIDPGQSSSAAVATYATMKSQLQSQHRNADPTFVSLSVPDATKVKQVVKRLNHVKAGKQYAYNVISIGDMLDTINTITKLASTILAAIAGISLIVSTLMIVVTMYMSVSERTKEIGILRALGESKRDIRRLFTAEALFLGVLSAVLGTVMAYGLGAWLNHAIYGLAKADMVMLTPGIVIFAFAAAIIISLLAALLPARQASRLNPITALAAD
jgi:ABC-type lipoprotein export system ATPase subunit/ABC-type lipoprotein release transport system permease subunit